MMAVKGRFPIDWDAKGAKYADVIAAQNWRDQDYIEDQRALLGEAIEDFWHREKRQIEAPLFSGTGLGLAIPGIAIEVHACITHATRPFN